VVPVGRADAAPSTSIRSGATSRMVWAMATRPHRLVSCRYYSRASVLIAVSLVRSGRINAS
jgi:hypothetical protein